METERSLGMDFVKINALIRMLSSTIIMVLF